MASLSDPLTASHCTPYACPRGVLRGALAEAHAHLVVSGPGRIEMDPVRVERRAVELDRGHSGPCGVGVLDHDVESLRPDPNPGLETLPRGRDAGLDAQIAVLFPEPEDALDAEPPGPRG